MAVADVFYSLGDFFGGTGKHAQKAFWNQRIQLQVNQGKLYINTDVPYKIYNSIPQFRIPINRLAAMFANGVFKIKMPDGTLKDLPPEWNKLFKKPNILQSQNSFMEQYMKQLKIYGNQYIKKNQSSKLGTPKSLMNISAAYIKPVVTGKLFDQVTMDGIVKYYEYTENSQIKKFETKEILWTKIDDVDNPLIGESPLKGLQFPISNTDLAYKYLNCISGEKGNIGILSMTPAKDSMGQLPADPKMKKDLEVEYRNQNGIEDNQKKIMITEHPVTWQPMTYPTKDLLLMEQIDANFLTILCELGVNSNIFINSTYENLQHGLRSTHTDTVMPIADSFSQSIGEFIGINESTGGELILDYSHLSYLQPDKLSEAATFSSVSSALNSLVSAMIITSQEAKIRLENQFGKVKP